MTDDELDALEQPERWSDVFDDATRAALRLADAMSGVQGEAIDPELITELQSHFEEVALAELLLVCGQANLNNRVGNVAKRLLGPDDVRVPSGR